MTSLIWEEMDKLTSWKSHKLCRSPWRILGYYALGWVLLCSINRLYYACLELAIKPVMQVCT